MAVLDQFGNPFRSTSSAPSWRESAFARLRAKWDAAATTVDNVNHWANADALSAAAAGAPEIRAKLRQRARYEIGNNCYAGGIVLTLAHDLIGTGPRLQVRSKSKAVNQFVEREFKKWARAIRLPQKLRTMRVAKAGDGETFGEFTTKSSLRTRVKLNLIPIEADQVTTPDLNPMAENAVDGIVFDGPDNPIEYHRLRRHPGDLLGDLKYDRVPARRMLHLFRADRPGQVRGIPELTPALPLFAQLRRWVLAVLASAETAADFAAVMYTDSPSLEPEDIPNLSLDDGMPIQQRSFQVLPNGWKIAQLKAEQPITQFGEFRSAILTEIARCVLVPRNVATGDSSGYNYSSGRLDRQMYDKAREVERSYWEDEALDRIFDAWLFEASLIDGYLPDEFYSIDDLETEWHWDGDEHVDPETEANAQETRLGNATTHRRRELAKAGVDIDTEDEIAARDYGVTVEEYRRRIFEKQLGGSSSKQTKGAKDGEATNGSTRRAKATARRAAA